MNHLRDDLAASNAMANHTHHADVGSQQTVMKHKTPLLLLVLAMLTSFACFQRPVETVAEKKRNQAIQIREDLRSIDACIDQYAIDNNKTAGASVVWADVKQYFRSGTRLYNSGGTDILGNSFTITSVDTVPKVSTTTYTTLSDVAPVEFWSPYR